MKFLPKQSYQPFALLAALLSVVPLTLLSGCGQPSNSEMMKDGTQSESMKSDGMMQDSMKSDGMMKDGMKSDGMKSDGMMKDAEMKADKKM